MKSHRTGVPQGRRRLPRAVNSTDGLAAKRCGECRHWAVGSKSIQLYLGPAEPETLASKTNSVTRFRPATPKEYKPQLLHESGRAISTLAAPRARMSELTSSGTSGITTFLSSDRRTWISFWGANPNSYFVSGNIQHGRNNMVANVDSLLRLATCDQHVSLLVFGIRPGLLQVTLAGPGFHSG